MRRLTVPGSRGDTGREAGCVVQGNVKVTIGRAPQVHERLSICFMLDNSGI